ncbi:MAG: hypothetical protein DRN26_02835, partial [Thermoplasmata archaeon]
LKLVRQPDNKYDSNAIAVLSCNVHVGYLPREIAQELAPRMDKGEWFQCFVIDSSLEKPCIRVRSAPLQKSHISESHPWYEKIGERYDCTNPGM